MLNRLAQTHLKFLAAGCFVVVAILFFRAGLHNDVREHIAGISSALTGSDGSGSGNSAPKPGVPYGPSHSFPGGLHPDVMTDAEAQQYCSNYRLEPFPGGSARPRKIYDLLLVNTELEMLEMRMGIMAPHVDYFVILESDRTFTDRGKPLYVADNWARFAPYHRQMIRRTMDLSALAGKSTWDREASSRDAMYAQVVPFLEGDQAAAVDDVLLVSDVDEVFKPATLRALRACAVPPRVTAHSRLFYYSFQWLSNADWQHPQATTYQGPAGTVRPDDLRGGAAAYTFPDGAWHCSYCFGTVAEMVRKITSFSHTEFDQPQFKDPKKVVWRVRNGVDIFDRNNQTRVENNPDVPEFILKNKHRYGFMLDRDPPNAGFQDYNVQDETLMELGDVGLQ